MEKLVVIAFGGNALLRKGGGVDYAAQKENVAQICATLEGMARSGMRMIIGHGNGPQVGRILLASETAKDVVPPMPFDVCGAMSQGYIGYHLQNALREVLLERGIQKPVTTLITQVEVVFEGEVKIFDLSEREPQPEYVMDEALAAAMRIPSSEIGLADNYFALAFIDDAENIELGVVMAGAATDKVLQAGTYDSSNDTLLASACEMYVYEPEGEYAFTSGVVVVTRDGDTYGFDIELTDEDGGIYHFTYEGVVLDMEPEEEPDIVDFEPVAVKADRVASWDVGNFELQLYIDSHNYHSLDMMDKVAPNNNYLSAGVYRKSDDTITKWSNLVANVTTGEGANVADAEIELSHNVDGTSTLRGFILSEYGKRINIDWTGTIEGFNFDAE